MLNRKNEKFILIIISIVYMVWSLAYFLRSSTIAIDGRRYFPLFDDALISMRYAWNLSHGSGLVWNPGEYVEGYTNFLMTLIMSAVTFIFDKSTALIVIKILGIGFMLAIANVSMRVADFLIQTESVPYPSLARILTFFCVLAYFPLVLVTFNGMETGFLTFLIISGIFFALHFVRSWKPVFLYLVAGCMGLAFLTRNDSILFVTPVCFYILWQTFQFKRASTLKIHFIVAVSIFILFIIGQEGFRFYYYGEWLPNTYYLKLTGLPLSIRISNGVGFLKPFFISSSLFLLVMILDLIFSFRKEKLIFLSILLIALGYQVIIGGDEWRFWRFISPAMPFVFIIFVMSIDEIIGKLIKSIQYQTYISRKLIHREGLFAHTLIIGLLFAGTYLINMDFASEILLLKKPYDDGFSEFINQAIRINQFTTSEATVGVVAAGTIPFFINRMAIDFLGVNDKYIARQPSDLNSAYQYGGMTSVPGHNKADLNYSIRTLQPTYLQTARWGSQDLSEWVDTMYELVVVDRSAFYLLRDSDAVLWEKIKNPD